MNLPEMLDVKSSNIARLGYDEKAEELYVVFKGTDKYVYIYTKVPSSLNSKLMTADSKGGFLHEYFVKTKWEYRRELL